MDIMLNKLEILECLNEQCLLQQIEIGEGWGTHLNYFFFFFFLDC